jgi:hypothetical protein
MQLKLIAILILFALPLQAGEVTLAWDAVQAGNLAGYRIYIGDAPGTYSRSIQTGNVTIFKVVNLADGTHYFAATAYDSSGGESGYSNEVFTTIAPAPFEIKTLAVSMQWFGVVLFCSTSQNANAIVKYTDILTGEAQAVITTLDYSKTEHRAVLYLPMGTQRYYTYEWSTTNAAGQTAILGGTFQVR